MNEGQKQLYAYLRDNGLTDLSSDKFFSAYSDPSKSKEIYSYMKQNGLTDLDENAFHVAYFSPAKKKSTTGSQSVQPKKPTSSATMPSWMQSSLESSVKKEEKPKKPAGPQVAKSSELNKDVQAEKIASMAGGGTAGISGVGAINAKPKKEEAPDFDVYYGYPGQEKNEYRISNGRWERKYGDKWVEVTNQGSISSLTKFFGKEKEITVDAVFTGFPGKEENKYRISELQNGKKVWEVQRAGQKDYTVISDQGSIDALNRQFDKKIEYAEDAQSKRDAQINRRESAAEDFKTVTGDLVGKESDEVAKYLTKMYGDRGFTFQPTGLLTDNIRVYAKGTDRSEVFVLDNFRDETDSAEALKLRKFLSENQQLGDYIDLEREELKKAEETIVDTEWGQKDFNKEMDRLKGAGSQAQFELAEKQNIEDRIAKDINKYSTETVEARKLLVRADYDTKQRIDDLTRTAKTKSEKQALAAIAVANKGEFVQKHRVDNAYLNDLNQASKSISSSFNKLNSDVEEFNAYVKNNNITKEQLENDPDLLAQKQELQVRYDQLIADAEDLDFENKKLPFIQNQNARNAALYFAYDETRGSVIGGTWNGFLRGALGSLQTFRITDKEGIDSMVEQFGSYTTKAFTQSENRNEFSKALLSTSESLGAAAAAFMTGGLAAEGTVASKILQFVPYFSVSYNEMKNEIDAIPGMNKVPWYKKEALAIAYGIGVGYLDKLSTNFQLKSKISNKIGRDLVLRSIAGLPKGATAEAIEMAIASNFKKDLAAGVIKVVAGSVVEGTTEGVQSAYGTGLKELYDWTNKVDKFDSREWVSQVFEEAYYGALGGTIMSTPSTLIKGIKNGFGRLDPQDMELARKVIEDSNMRSMVITDIKAKLMSGEITKDQANEQIEAIKESESLFAKIPDNLSAEDTSKAMDLIKERSKIEADIKGKDKDLVSARTRRITAINNELKAISENATKKSTEQEVTAEGGGVQREGVVEGQPEGEQGEGTVGQTTEQGTDLGDSTVKGRSKEEIDARVSELEAMLANDAASVEETGIGSLLPEAKTQIQNELEALKTEVPVKAEMPTVEVAAPKIAETTDTKAYSEALGEAKAALKEEGNGLDLQVSDVSPEEADAIVAEGGKIFMTEDGLAGAYVKKDGYMGGLFKSPKATYKNVAKLLQQARIKVGGRFMDAYATELERIYTENGFRPVARLKFNEEYAPEGWDAPGSALAGKPDVVFFAYDPEGKYKIGDGEYVTDYDAAYEMAKNFDAKVSNEADKLAELMKGSTVVEGTNEQVDALIKEISDSDIVVAERTILEQVANATKALKSILPNVKFVFHSTNESYKKAVGDSSRGAYDPKNKVIHINLTKANNRTVMHEVFHAIIISKVSSDAKLQSLTKNMVKSVIKSLKQSGANQNVITYLEEFSAGYEVEEQNEEKLSELFALIGETYKSLPYPTQNIIQRFLDRVAKMFGLKEMTDREVVDFMNTMSSKVETGKEITTKEFKKVKPSKTDKFGNLPKPSKSSIENLAKRKQNIVDETKANVVEGKIVSTRLPKQDDIHSSDKYVVSMSSLEESAKDNKGAKDQYIKIATEISSYGISKIKNVETFEDAQKVVKEFKDSVKSNLKWLYDSFGNDVRDISKLWYDGANKICNKIASEYNYSLEQVSGVMAVLSPQMDWFRNLSLGERVIDIYTKQQDSSFDSKMIDYVKNATSGTGKNKVPLFKDAKEIVSRVNGKKLSELNNKDKAYFIRVFDEVYNSREYNNISPNGEVNGLVRKGDGTPGACGWGGFSTIEKSISILQDGSINNISSNLGNMHKVRNFFNNISNPNDKNAVTIDTHAVAAGLLLPLSGNSKQVAYNFGGAGNVGTGMTGTYPVYADAYRELANELGLLPREVQSITWEAVRGLFKATFKSNKNNEIKINNVWDKYSSGEISLDQSHSEISNIAGGISKPVWFEYMADDNVKSLDENSAAVDQANLDDESDVVLNEPISKAQIEEEVKTLEEEMKPKMRKQKAKRNYTDENYNIVFEDPNYIVRGGAGKNATEGYYSWDRSEAIQYADGNEENLFEGRLKDDSNVLELETNNPENYAEIPENIKIFEDITGIKYDSENFSDISGNIWNKLKKAGYDAVRGVTIDGLATVVLNKKAVDPIIQEESKFRKQKASDQAAVIVKKGKEANLSDAGIREYMKRNGYTDRQATDAIQAYNDKQEGIFVDPEWSKLRRAAVVFKRKFLSARGLMPNSAFASNESREAQIAKSLNMAEKNIADFNRALKKVPKDQRDKIREDFDAYIRDKSAILPAEFKKIADTMRAHIDSISKDLIVSGLIDEHLSERVIDNIGSYLTRSYKVYDRANWKKEVEEEVKQKAINFLKIQYTPIAKEIAQKEGMDFEDVLDRIVTNKFNEILTKEGAENFITGGKIGSKNLSILKERQDIPLEIRMLMGEYTDPAQNYAKTILKMSALAANHHFLTEVKKNGTGVFLFEKNDARRPKGFDYMIAAEGSDTMNPLNGMYTTKEIKEEFEKQPAQLGSILELYMKALSMVKWGKTIGSLMTHAKNVFGNIGFVLLNGHWRVNEMGRAYKTVKNDLFSRDKAGLRDYMNRLIELGIVKQSAGIGELRAMFKDASWDEAMIDRINKKTESKWEWVKSKFKKGTKFMEDLYQSEDDFFKIVAYENELSRYSKAMFGKRKTELTESERTEVDKVVAEIVKNTYPTYSRIPELVNMIRRFPFIGNFISFQAESYRTAFNTAALSLDEIKSKNPGVRQIGAQRLIGSLTYMTAKTAILSAFSNAVGMGAVGIYGYFTDDEEEKQKEKDVRNFIPEWSKNSDLLMLKASGGKIKYIDFSSSDPHGGINKAINSLLSGDKSVNGFINAMGSVIEPFVGEEMTTAAILAVKNNKNAYGKPIYNPEDTFYEKFKDISAHMLNVVQPGTVSTVRRAAESESLLNEIVGASTGMRIYEVDVAEQFGYSMITFGKRIDDANRIYTSEVYNEEATEKSIASAKKRAEKAVTEIHAEIYDLYYSAVRLGADEDKLYDNLKSFGGMTKRTINYMFGQEEFYINNKYPDEE